MYTTEGIDVFTVSDDFRSYGKPVTILKGLSVQSAGFNPDNTILYVKVMPSYVVQGAGDSGDSIHFYSVPKDGDISHIKTPEATIAFDGTYILDEGFNPNDGTFYICCKDNRCHNL